MARTSLDTIVIPEHIKRMPWDFVYSNDFIDGPLTGVMSHLAADSSATVTNAGVHGGGAMLTTAATDNNEVAIATQKCLLWTQNKPWYVQGRITHTEANTDDANLFFGAGSAITTANWMVDDGAGMVTSASFAGFFKTGGGTVWRIGSSKGASQTLQTTETNVASGTPITFAIHCWMVDATYAYINFLCDPLGGANLQPVRVASQSVRVPDAATSQHQVAISSAAAMMVGAYAKAGGANSETPVLDYLYVCGRR